MKAAERNLASAQGTNKAAEKQLADKKHLMDVWKDEQKKNEEQVKAIQDDNEKYKSQQEKNQAYLQLRKDDAAKANSAIKKAAVVSFFVGLANSTAQNAKGFMDQLTVGASEAVVKGKVYQIENELKELENTYRLKGETALAKDSSKVKHLQKAEEIKKNNPNYNKDPEYNKEQFAASEDEKRSKELQDDRTKLAKAIEQKEKELAKARVEEAKQLEDLHQKLKEQYKVNPEADALDIEVKTNLNKLVQKAAKEKVDKFVAENADFADILTSNAYLEADAAQRLVIKEQVKIKANEKAVEDKAKTLESYSNKLKGLFTPNNMSRIDTVVGAAETIVGLYGSVKKFVTGGGGDDKENEDSKGIADKIADMKEKAANVRKGMMEDGGDKEKEQGVVDNVLDITQSLREITESIASKIETIAKDYDDVLDDQRQIKMHADNEVKAYQAIFNDSKNKNLTLPEAFAQKRGNDIKRIQKALDDSIEVGEKAVENSKQPIVDAEKELKVATNEKNKADSVVAEAQKKLDHLVDIEVQKDKGKALNVFRGNRQKLGDLAYDGYGNDLQALFPKTEDEIRDEGRWQMKKEADRQFAEQQKKFEEQNAAAEAENKRLKEKLEAERKAFEAELKAFEAKKRELEEAKKKLQEQNDTQKGQLDQQAEREERERQRVENERQQAELQKRNENEAKMDKLRDILDNLNDTNNGYFGHKNSKQFEQVQNKLYDFISNKADNISFEPDQTEKLKTALTDYLKHVGMGVASHKNGNIRKENVLAALNIIDPKEALVYKGMADAKRDGKGSSKQIDLEKLMEKEYIKRENKPRRELKAGNVSKPSKEFEGPKPAPLAPKKNK
jgi:hypothetical protein